MFLRYSSLNDLISSKLTVSLNLLGQNIFSTFQEHATSKQMHGESNFFFHLFSFSFLLILYFTTILRNHDRTPLYCDEQLMCVLRTMSNTSPKIFPTPKLSRKEIKSSLYSEVGERECQGDTKEIAAFSIT